MHCQWSWSESASTSRSREPGTAPSCCCTRFGTPNELHVLGGQLAAGGYSVRIPLLPGRGAPWASSSADARGAREAAGHHRAGPLFLLESATDAITADVDRDRLGAASLAHLDRYMPI